MLGDNLQCRSDVHDGRMTLVESGYFDADIAAPLQQHLDAAYKMFREFCSQRRIQCSQPPFKEKMELWAELAKNNVQKNHGCLGWKVSTAWSWMFLGKFNICIFSAATFYLAPRFWAYVYVSKVGFFWPLVFFSSILGQFFCDWGGQIRRRNPLEFEGLQWQSGDRVAGPLPPGCGV